MAEVWPIWIAMSLAVGAAAALVGRPRAYVVASAGAVCWWVLALASGSTTHPAGLIFGACAIAAVAVGSAILAVRPAHTSGGDEADCGESHTEQTCSVSAVEIFRRFDEWLAAHRNRPDPWPDFGEFITNVLFLTYKAKHTRAYRLLATDDDVLFPLRSIEPERRDFPNARSGIVGHVVTTGKSYYVGDPGHGELLDELARNEPNGAVQCSWCFAVQHDRRTIGVVCVGEADAQCLRDRTKTQLVEGLISLCWMVLTESCRSRLADETDPVSGALTYGAFSHTANIAIDTAYARGEPVAIVNVNVEGLRCFADHGQWELANQTLYEVCSLLKQRLRDEDQVGVFDGSRFLILLRRVDSALAMLIVRKLMDRVSLLCTSRSAAGCELRARCGIAGSGLTRPSLHTLIERATSLCQQARLNGEDIAADLDQADRSEHAEEAQQA